MGGKYRTEDGRYVVEVATYDRGRGPFQRIKVVDGYGVLVGYYQSLGELQRASLFDMADLVEDEG